MKRNVHSFIHSSEKTVQEKEKSLWFLGASLVSGVLSLKTKLYPNCCCAPFFKSLLCIQSGFGALKGLPVFELLSSIVKNTGLFLVLYSLLSHCSMC